MIIFSPSLEESELSENSADKYISSINNRK